MIISILFFLIFASIYYFCINSEAIDSNWCSINNLLSTSPNKLSTCSDDLFLADHFLKISKTKKKLAVMAQTDKLNIS